MNNEKTYIAVRFRQNNQYNLSKVYLYEISNKLLEHWLGCNYTNGKEFFPKFYNISSDSKIYGNPVMIAKIFHVDHASEEVFRSQHPIFTMYNMVTITDMSMAVLPESPSYPYQALTEYYDKPVHKTRTKEMTEIIVGFEMKTVPEEFWRNGEKYDVSFCPSMVETADSTNIEVLLPEISLPKNYTSSLKSNEITCEHFYSTATAPVSNGLYNSNYDTKLPSNNNNNYNSNYSATVPNKPSFGNYKTNAPLFVYEPSESKIEINNINNEEGKKNMFENMFKNVKMGKAENVEMSIYGPAFFSADGTKLAFNKEDETWTDVTGMTLDFNIAYMFPVSKKEIGRNDFILHQNQWVRVVDFDEAGRPVVEKIFSKEVVTIMPTKNLFGFDFYTKLMALGFDGMNMGASEDNPFGSMLPLMMMSGNGDMKEMLPMMLMMSGYLAGMDPMIAYFLMSGKDDNKDMLPMLLMMNSTHKPNKNE